MTTGEIKETAIKILDLMGYEVWKQNNIAVRGRKFHGKRGVPDIIGFARLDGKFVLCEAKNKGDILSDEQENLLKDAKVAGCHCFIATVDKNGGFELTKF